ncbi:M91 family zinc metallopeptidase [Pseudomonas canadensis]|nr:M91 family zinc metallopeptidase [Pseudomonas canadensis]MEB2647013.1 M91 family zinc metallopeptidase [Pseudomonas canadensis]
MGALLHDNDPSTEPTTTNPEPFSENGLRKELGLPPRTASRSTQTRA